jgi:hypothetical protein
MAFLTLGTKTLRTKNHILLINLNRILTQVAYYKDIKIHGIINSGKEVIKFKKTANSWARLNLKLEVKGGD